MNTLQQFGKFVFQQPLRRLKQPFHRKQKNSARSEKCHGWLTTGSQCRQVFLGIASLYLKRLPSRARNGGHTRYASNPRRKNQNNFRQRQVFCHCLRRRGGGGSLLAKEALAAAIRNAGLSVYSYPEKQKNFAEKWLSVLPVANNNPLTFSTSILIPKSKIETQEISYTEDDRYVSINISATKEEISKENVVFKTLPAKVDAVFYFPPFGPNQPNEKLPEELSKKITAPEPDNVMSISSGAKGETISEKVFNIIQTIESSGDISIKKSPVPDILLASLFAETDQLQKNLNEETLTLASSLIKLGADKEKITDVLNDKSPSFARLLGRALARSYPNESLKSMWTFIAEQDLEKTGNEPGLALFGKIMKKLKNLLEPRPFLS